MPPALQPIDVLSSGLLPPRVYESARAASRRRMIAYRRTRTLALGPCMRLQFEDALTLRYQLQEVLRAERIADAHAARCEAAAYAHLLPDTSNWTATLFIELPDAAQRACALLALSLAAHRIRLEAGGHSVTAAANEDLADGCNARHLERPSGVHFLRFGLSTRLRAAIDAGTAATLLCDGPACRLRAPIPAALLELLRTQTAPAIPSAALSPLRKDHTMKTTNRSIEPLRAAGAATL